MPVMGGQKTILMEVVLRQQSCCDQICGVLSPEDDVAASRNLPFERVNLDDLSCLMMIEKCRALLAR
jgi:hypothetical protein